MSLQQIAPQLVIVSEKNLAIAPVLDSCLVFSAHGSRSCFAMWFRSLSHLMLFWEFNSLSKILSFSEKQVEDHWERLKSAGLDLLSNARLEKNCKISTKYLTYIFLLAYSHSLFWLYKSHQLFNVCKRILPHSHDQKWRRHHCPAKVFWQRYFDKM